MCLRGITSLLIARELNWLHNPIDIPVYSVCMVSLVLPSAIKIRIAKPCFPDLAKNSQNSTQ